MHDISMQNFSAVTAPIKLFNTSDDTGENISLTAWPDAKGWDIVYCGALISLSREALSAINFLTGYLEYVKD